MRKLLTLKPENSVVLIKHKRMYSSFFSKSRVTVELQRQVCISVDSGTKYQVEEIDDRMTCGPISLRCIIP